MNNSRNLKIVYLVAVVVCFCGILYLQEQVLKPKSVQYKLAQSELGDVDPVAGSTHLVLAGFKGIAVTMLWSQAIELKREQRWFEIEPVLGLITKLQPHFLKPWTYQAWNMAYNISAEWESVDDKYDWTRRGIDFMKDANRVNDDQPDMEWYTGWLYFNRFGVSDENEYLRQMFREETDAEFAQPKVSRVQDAYLKSYDYFKNANDMVMRLKQKPKQRGIVPFMSYEPLSWIKYADKLNEEGTYGERATNAWRTGEEEWRKFGRRGTTGRSDDTFKMHRLEYSGEQWKELTEEEQYWSEHYAKIVNYYFWRLRAQTEQRPEMQQARQAFFNARKAYEEGDFTTAIEQYEKGFPLWKKVIQSDPELQQSVDLLGETQEFEYQYLEILKQLGQPLPERDSLASLFPDLIGQDNRPGRIQDRQVEVRNPDEKPIPKPQPNDE